MSKKRAPRLPDRSPIACPDCSGQLHLQHKPASWGGGGDFVYLLRFADQIEFPNRSAVGQR